MEFDGIDGIYVKQGILYRVVENFPEEGVRFIDLTPSLMNEIYKEYITSQLALSCISKNVDYIICPDARGFLWGMAVASKLDIPIIPVRKTGKLPKESVAYTEVYKTEYSETSLDLPKGMLANTNVMFIDDVYATGGTYEACKRLVEKAGGKLVGASVVYDVGLVNNEEIKSITRGDL